MVATSISPLLDLLFPQVDGLVDLRALPVNRRTPVAQVFVTPGDVDALMKFVDEHPHDNHYFGVATRRDASSGALENCFELSTIFVDVDFNHTPEATARERLSEFPFPPSAVILSGHGLHVYWVLREPLNLQDPVECALAKSLLRRLAYILGADLQAAEPARVLRLPGTSNFKYTPPRQVLVDHLADEAELQYHASDFDELLPPEPAASAAPFRSPERILDGSRNDTLYRCGRSMKTKGFGRTAIGMALHAENQDKCDPPLSDQEVENIVASAWTQADRAGFLSAPPDDPPVTDPPALPARLGQGLGSFLGLDFPPTLPLIEGLLSNDGGGWISGEEKLGKSYYALLEAICLALGLPVCGRFAVPTRMRVLFIEEEDPPSRLARRITQLLRGLGLNPDDPAVRADLDQWFLISVWNGFTVDEPARVAQLRATLDAFRPTVVYLDVLRKLTVRDLNKADQAGAFLKVLDDLRREFGSLFRTVAHNRKIQGSFRAGRGSQELAGSFQLGAWGENSLFFEPVGKTGQVKVTVQRKDGAQTPAFVLRFETEGPLNNPTHVRLHADAPSTAEAIEALQDRIIEVVPDLQMEEASNGQFGVSIERIGTAVSRSEAPVRQAIRALIAANDGRLREVGKVGRGRKLYGVGSP